MLSLVIWWCDFAGYRGSVGIIYNIINTTMWQWDSGIFIIHRLKFHHPNIWPIYIYMIALPLISTGMTITHYVDMRLINEQWYHNIICSTRYIRNVRIHYSVSVSICQLYIAMKTVDINSMLWLFHGIRDVMIMSMAVWWLFVCHKHWVAFPHIQLSIPPPASDISLLVRNCQLL